MPKNVVKREVIINYLTGINTVSANAEKIRKDTAKMAEGITGSSKQATAGLKQLAGAYNALVTAKHAGRLMAGAIKPAMDMEVAMTDLSVATGLAGTGLDQVKQAAYAAAMITPFDPTEAVKAARSLNLVMRDVLATTEALGPTMSLAATFMDNDLNAATTLANKLLAGFRLESDQLAPTLDKLAIGARAIGVQVSDLTGGFRTLGQVAGGIRSTFEDVYLGYLLAVRGGLAASNAATLMSSAMFRLSRTTVQKGLKENLGVVVQAGRRFLSFQDILLQLYEAFKSTAPVDFQRSLQEAFGLRTAKVIMPMLLQMSDGVKDANGHIYRGAELLKYYQREIKNSGGALVGLTGKAMQPMAKQIEMLEEAWRKLLVEVFTPMVEKLTPLVTGIKNFVEWLQELVATSLIARYLATTISRLSGVLITFLGIGLAVKGMIWIVRAALSFLGATVARTATVWTWLMNSIGWAPIRMGAAATASTTLGRTLLFVSRAVRVLWTAVLGLFSLFLMLPELINAVKLALNEIWVARGKGPLFKEAYEDYHKTRERAEEKIVKEQIKRNQAQSKAAEKLLRTTEAANELMQQWKDIEKLKMPMTDPAVIRRLGAGISGLESYLPKEGMAKLRGHYKAVTDVQALLAKREHVSPEKVAAANKSMQFLTKAMMAFYAHDSKFIQGVVNLGKTFANALEGSAAFSAVAVELGYDVQRLYDAKKAYSDMAQDRMRYYEIERQQYAEHMKRVALAVSTAEVVERVIRANNNSLLLAVPGLAALAQKRAWKFTEGEGGAAGYGIVAKTVISTEDILKKFREAGVSYREEAAKYKESQPWLSLYKRSGAKAPGAGGGTSLADAVANMANQVGALVIEVKRKKMKPLIVNARLHAKDGDQVFTGETGAPGMSLLPPYL